MKKTTRMFMLALIAVGTLSACKKEYTCKCTATITVPGLPSTSDDESTTIPKTTKKKAEKTCKDIETQLKNEVGQYGTATCSL